MPKAHKTIAIVVDEHEYELVRRAAFEARVSKSRFLYENLFLPALRRGVFLPGESKKLDSASRIAEQ